MFVYAGVVNLGFHRYWLDFSFSLFIWKNTNSFGPENIWVVLWLFVLLKSPQEKQRLISRNTIPLLQPEELQSFHSSRPFTFSLEHILLQDYLYNTLFMMNRYFFPLTFPFSVLPEQKKTTFPVTSSVKILCDMRQKLSWEQSTTVRIWFCSLWLFVS